MRSHHEKSKEISKLYHGTGRVDSLWPREWDEGCLLHLKTTSAQTALCLNHCLMRKSARCGVQQPFIAIKASQGNGGNGCWRIVSSGATFASSEPNSNPNFSPLTVYRMSKMAENLRGEKKSRFKAIHTSAREKLSGNTKHNVNLRQDTTGEEDVIEIY